MLCSAPLPIVHQSEFNLAIESLNTQERDECIAALRDVIVATDKYRASLQTLKDVIQSSQERIHRESDN